MFKIQGDLEHHYYGAMQALFDDNEGELGVSRSTIDKWDFSKKDYENNQIIIRIGHLTTGPMVRKYNKAADQALDKIE